MRAIALGILALTALVAEAQIPILNAANGGVGFDDKAIEDSLKQLIEEYRTRAKEEAENELDDGDRIVEFDDSDNDDVPTMIAKWGYPVEEHTITTEDCYILHLHRIPFGKEDPPVAGVVRPAVYLQHGLLCSSADWVIAAPEKSLGYILADNGYDVWIGNFRGNTYGRDHCTMDPDRDKDFWHFSWDQMGKYDIPAMIDHIIQYTGQSKIHYVGHSMGTTTFMVMAQERPEYLDKIIMANLMAPVAYVEHMKSPIRLLAPFADIIAIVADALGLGEFLPDSIFSDIIADLFCDPILFPPIICESVIFLMCGYDPEQMNETLLERITYHTPAGTSTFTVVQYAQEVPAPGGFHKYDLGSGNTDAYGVNYPPEYYPGNTTVPVSIYWGQNDWLAQPSDVLSLVSQLPYVYDDYEVPFDQWNHLDFLYGIDAYTLLYPQVMDNMARAQAEFAPLP